jgi:dipicolinate synthase subunit A
MSGRDSMNQYHFLVLGDEPRQMYLSELLKEKGQQVMTIPESAVSAQEEYEPGSYDAVLLPVPNTRKYLEAVVNRLKKGQIVYGCNFPLELVEECDKRGIHCIDYMKTEGVAVRNAVATAEGAVAEALADACVTIQGSRCLLTGYGCCGQVLAEKLLSLKAHVTVMERKSGKRAAAKGYGCEAVSFDLPPQKMQEFDYIFNTVPALVLTETLLAHVREDVRIIDIASRPGGVDFDYCQKKGINAKLCLGLPGKYAPKSSAGILLEVIGKTILGEM